MYSQGKSGRSDYGVPDLQLVYSTRKDHLVERELKSFPVAGENQRMESRVLFLYQERHLSIEIIAREMGLSRLRVQEIVRRRLPPFRRAA
jgi:hypothetical protein